MSDDFERHITDIARQLQYPPTPVKQTIARPTYRLHPLRYALGVVLVISLFGLALPDIRAAVLEFLQMGVVTVYLDGHSTTGQPLDLDHVSGETTLDMVQSQVEFTLMSFADDLPDRVFVQESSLVIFVWITEGLIEKTLYQTTDDDLWRIYKVSAVFEEVRIGNMNAYWINVQHPIQFEYDGQVQRELTHFVSGNVLVWEQDGITYRLESRLLLDDARAMVALLEPLTKSESSAED